MSERGKKLTGLSIAIFSLGIKGIPLLEKQKKKKRHRENFWHEKSCSFPYQLSAAIHTAHEPQSKQILEAMTS
jgi:hypothetical protein